MLWRLIWKAHWRGAWRPLPRMRGISFHALRSAYAKTPTRLKIIDVYFVYGLITAFIQVVYMAIVGTFPFNAFLSGVLSCIGTSVLGGTASNLVPCLFDLLMITRIIWRYLFIGTREMVYFQVHIQRKRFAFLEKCTVLSYLLLDHSSCF